MSRAKATCLCCRTVLPPERVRAQLAAQRGGADAVFDEQSNRTGGARMTAVVTLKPGRVGRHYRLPTDSDYAAVRLAQARVEKIFDEWEGDGRRGLCPVPDEPLPLIGTLGFRVQRYGMLQWGDLFTARQKIALMGIGAVDIRSVEQPSAVLSGIWSEQAKRFQLKPFTLGESHGKECSHVWETSTTHPMGLGGSRPNIRCIRELRCSP